MHQGRRQFIRIGLDFVKLSALYFLSSSFMFKIRTSFFGKKSVVVEFMMLFPEGIAQEQRLADQSSIYCDQSLASINAKYKKDGYILSEDYFETSSYYRQTIVFANLDAYLKWELDLKKHSAYSSRKLRDLGYSMSTKINGLVVYS